MDRYLKISVGVLLAIVIYILDISMQLGVAGGVPYVAFVLLGLWYKDKRVVLYLGVIATLLTLLGLFTSPEGGEYWKVLLNRGYAVFAIWIVAIGVYKQKIVQGKLEKLADRLKNYNVDLEKQVMKRTSDLADALEHQMELNEMKSRFVSTASHEFRTPLSTILSSVSLIGKYTDGNENEKLSKHIVRIKSSVNNLTDILDDFLSLEKLEQGKLKVKTNRFNLRVLCQDLVVELNVLKKEGQEIHITNNKVEIVINLDEDLIRNILSNLLSNAIKFSPENSSIDLLATSKNGELTIEVKDGGIGISKGDTAHIFEKFFRADNAENIQGTGLGLNIVKRYVEIMGGKITFESELNKGSTFRAQFPQRF